jgi:phosphinothricin acetyltransferase
MGGAEFAQRMCGAVYSMFRSENMSSGAVVRAATAADAAAMAHIYNHYVSHTVVTFEESPVSVAGMASRLTEVDGLGLPWLMAETPAGVRGYAHAGPWKNRCAYRHSVEVTVYIDSEAVGQGLGTQLYTALFTALRQSEVHFAIGGIALPNDASVALHEKFGMRKVAHFSEVGWKFGRWIDVGYWQLLLPAPAATPPA